ncbi:MAG: hypothetical protein HUK22_05530, partial [Thermoguttaceae bacterium]|nr:hypothetical protein [Thermoguttaceae bacterium]
LTINIQGMVREYSLKNSVHFTVKNQAGYILVPTEKIELERSMTYDYSDALSRDKENDLLRHDMANEAAQQLIRQLAAIKSMKGTPPEKKPKKGKAQTSPAKQKPADVQDSSPSPSSGAQSLILRR